MRRWHHRLRTWTDQLAHRALWRAGQKFEFGQMPVAITVRNGTQREHIWEQLSRALRLVKRVDPLRADRMEHDLGGMLVHSFAFLPDVAGYFHSQSGLCVLNSELITQFGESAFINLAFLIVHEATHARLCNACDLAEPLPETVRLRIERRCILAERAFARRLPKSELFETGFEDRLRRLPHLYSNAGLARLERRSRAARAKPLARWKEHMMRMSDLR